MKFTDGYWMLRKGVAALYLAERYDVVARFADFRRAHQAGG